MCRHGGGHVRALYIYIYIYIYYIYIYIYICVCVCVCVCAGLVPEGLNVVCSLHAGEPIMCCLRVAIKQLRMPLYGINAVGLWRHPGTELYTNYVNWQSPSAPIARWLI